MRIFIVALAMLSSLVGANSFAQEDVTIEGNFLISKHCSPLKLVKGVIFGTSRRIVVCAGDTESADFTNGATVSALSDKKTYFIVGVLHEGTLSVSEVAGMNE